MTLSSKKLWLAAAMALFMLAAAGCNDTLRQFIIPIPKPPGDPGALGNAIVLSTNPAASSNGSTLHIDVSGDTIVGQVTTGPNPVFFSLAGSRMYVINGDNTLTTYIALLPTTPPFSTVVLPTSGTDAATTPVAGGTGSSGNFFTTNRGSNNSSIINASFLSETGTITLPAGSTAPVAIAGNTVNSKMYVVNNGSGDVTVVSTVDNTVIKPSIKVGSQPIWGVMTPNGADVFIVNQGSGTVSVIDTQTDTVIATVAVGSSPNFASFENNRQRLYVSNTGDSTVSVIKADGIDPNATPPVLPVLLKNVPVSSAPVSVAGVPDGSKVYAALGGCPAGTNHTNLVLATGPSNLNSCNGNQVSVIDANALVEKKTITVGPGVVSVATSSDSLRVYAVSAHDTTTIADNVGTGLPPRTFTTPSIYDIKTSSDTVIPRTTDPSVTSSPVATFLAPSQDPACTPTIDSGFNKSVPMPCAGQLPFMVRTFP